MPPLELSCVDDVLGPRAGRFLGEGFKRATHSLSGITIAPRPQADAGITATAHLTPPAGRTRQDDRDDIPARLSAIDAMLFGAQLTGLYAAHTLQLPPDARFAVQHLELRAKTGQGQDEPAKFPVSGRPVDGPHPGPRTATTLECRIGSLTARVHARHSPAPTDSPPGPEQVYDLPQELPGPWNEAPYGIAHTARQQLLTQVSASIAQGRACARATLAPHRAAAIPAGSPATMIDALVAVLQLGQVLLYALDGLDHAHGDDLRMRRIRITAAGAPAARPTDQVSAALAQAQLVPSPAGIWRTAEVRGALHGIQVQAGVAHLLPAAWPGHDRPGP
ncbi:AvrD family protein [Streptomyces sp. NPDC093510]|uniref:AvrD family protein n=1 Tax=Streptomyces sp. NPDC093510 TaxID=3155199 RepID=UPI0034200EC9